MAATYSIETDMFPEIFSERGKVFRAVLSDPGLVEKVAMSRCYYALSPHVRGDGKKAGWSVILYGLPGFCPVEISHPHARIIAELARIAPPKKTRGVKFTPPCETAIAEAVKRIHAALVARLTAAAALTLEELNP